MRKLAKIVNQRLGGTLVWFSHPKSNTFPEGLNGIIQVSKRMVRRYVNVLNLIDMIYLKHGNLA